MQKRLAKDGLLIVLLIITTTLYGCGRSSSEVENPKPAAGAPLVQEEQTLNTPAEKTETTGSSQPAGTISGVEEVSGLVPINRLDNTIVIDMRYAGQDNFTGRAVYPYDICVLRKETAQKLVRANAELKKAGCRLKVWDAYRPLSVQRLFWSIVPDERYVANPDKGGSNHNRGTAVDVTLVDMAGNELIMPTGFDDFTSGASRYNKNVEPQIAKNLELLTRVMVENGFKTIDTEWWHFDDTETGSFPVLDIGFEMFFQSNTGNSGASGSGLTDAEQGASGGTDMSDKFKPGVLKCLGDSKQIVVAAADSFNTAAVTVYTYAKEGDEWKEFLLPFSGTIGMKGFTSAKREGDGKSPIGAFNLERCFSTLPNPGTKLNFTQFCEGDYWVDDVKSPYYNTFQRGQPGGRWDSAEDLFKIGSIYKYFIAVEYNTGKRIVPGIGSAIFMHIWRGENIATEGCLAMPEDKLLDIIRWLDPEKKPKLIQGPENELSKI